MTRRIASKVHQQASRLIKAKLIQQTPAWFDPVMKYPPLPLPPRTPPQRSAYDLPSPKPSQHSLTAHHTPSKHSRTPKPRPLPIHYIEDKVRKQFFKDHPFEAFRPIALVEDGTIEEEHPIGGREWTRLSQHGGNPKPEDAVRFAVHLHTVHQQPLTVAYRSAASQFEALRSEQYIMSCFAALEAEAYGAVFRPGEIERGFNMEEKALESWEHSGELDDGALAARKRWRAVVERRDPGKWTRGQAYVQLWKEGVRPDYTPVLNAPVAPVEEFNLEETPATAWLNFNHRS